MPGQLHFSRHEGAFGDTVDVVSIDAVTKPMALMVGVRGRVDSHARIATMTSKQGRELAAAIMACCQELEKHG